MRAVVKEPPAWRADGAFSAITAFALGLVQFAAPKGTLPHRAVGWTWALLMLAVSISSLFIHELRLWGAWSPIHLLSTFTLAMVPVAVIAAHHHNVTRHRSAMTGLFLGAPVIAGAFTFLPGPDHARGRVRTLSGCPIE